MLMECVEVLSVLEKIIHLTARQTGTDITKLARWLRCLFNLALTYDESISFKCIDEAVALAVKYQGVSVHSLSHRPRIVTRSTQKRVLACAHVTHIPPRSLDSAKYVLGGLG
jgi:hypothetical protein